MTTYPKPADVKVTVDIVIFAMRDTRLEVLLIKRKFAPYAGQWALPGGFVLQDEGLDDAARRELVEETGISQGYLEQLYSFGRPGRDPRGHVVTVAYFALLDHLPDPAASTDAEDSRWVPVKDLPPLAFDHAEILAYARERLKTKFEYTTASFSLLPKRFMLSDLQRVYEAVLERPLDKRNFRKKILSLDILNATGELEQRGISRPGELYEFSAEKFETLRSRGLLFPF
jgi:8-oxo-dGTP diphosphatase